MPRVNYNLTVLAPLARRVFLGFPLLVVCPTESGAREFWEAKVPGAWTPQEIRTLITQSPWAITGRMQSAPEPTSEMGTFRPGPLTPEVLAARQRGISADPGGRIEGMDTPAQHTQNAPGVAFYGETTIRWESAAPAAAVATTPLPAEFAGYYVISVTGLPSVQLESAMPQGMKPFLGTSLAVKDRPAAPAEYVFLTKDKKTVGFAFPSDRLPLRKEDGVATFTMVLQGLGLRANFNLKTMLYRGKLQLQAGWPGGVVDVAPPHDREHFYRWRGQRLE
jgi:hypothetical protein